jgi:hypothetical protein
MSGTPSAQSAQSDPSVKSDCCLIHIEPIVSSTSNIQRGKGDNAYRLYIPMIGTSVNVVRIVSVSESVETETLSVKSFQGEEIKGLEALLKDVNNNEAGTISSVGYSTLAIRATKISNEKLYGSTQPFWPYNRSSGFSPSPNDYLVIDFLVNPGTWVPLGPKDQVNVNIAAECK